MTAPAKQRPAGQGDDISLIALSKSFGGVAAVRDCTVEIAAGCVTGIVGPNGAGKSTIFNLMTGFVVPDKGQVLFRGANLVGRSPAQIFRAGIVRSFQGVRTLGRLTVIENLLLGGTAATALATVFRPRRDRSELQVAVARAWSVLAELGLEPAANRLAGGLSYAEQKLLSIGRLIMTDAPVVLLDEPLGGLDSNTIDQFIDRVRDLVLSHGRTVCIVEHNLNAVRRIADNVVFMAEGAVKAVGPTAEIMQREDLARLYLGVVPEAKDVA
ncbi:MAG: ATP-binding cassette domain-containing protein [Rhodospirillales bacterium]